MKLLPVVLLGLSAMAADQTPKMISAAQCGVVANTGIDQYPALAACIASAPATGARIDLGAGVIEVSRTIEITGNNIRLVGEGGAGSIWSPSSATVIRYTGEPGQPVIVARGAGYEHGTMLYGFGVEQLAIDGNGLASGCVELINTDSPSMLQMECRGFGGGSGVWITTTRTDHGCGAAYANLDGVKIASLLPRSSGLRLGNRSTASEVCANRFSNLTIDTSTAPGNHSILLDYTDSNVWSNIYAGGLFGEIAVQSIITNPSGTVATVTAANHGIPVGTVDDGIYILNPCTYQTSAPCNNVNGLKGAFGATVIDADHLLISGLSGLTPNTTYYAQTLRGASVQFNATWHNEFGQLFTLFGIYCTVECQSGYNGNFISGWNWREASYTDSGYAHLPAGISAIDTLGHAFNVSPAVTTTVPAAGSIRLFAANNQQLPSGAWATAVEPFVAPKAGTYSFHCSALITPSQSGVSRAARLMRGASRLDWEEKGRPLGVENTSLRVATDVDLVAGDTVRFEVYQDSGVPIWIIGGEGLTHCSVRF